VLIDLLATSLDAQGSLEAHAIINATTNTNTITYSTNFHFGSID
jgi:hypothetical protein